MWTIMEEPNEAADVQSLRNTDNFQTVPEEKLSFHHNQPTKESKLENMKRHLKEKMWIYSGLAGDLISPTSNQHMSFKTKCYNTNESLSQPTQCSSFNDKCYAIRTSLTSLSSKLQRKKTLRENENCTLAFTATNDCRLKKDTKTIPQFEDQGENSFELIVTDEIKGRAVPESYMNITKNKESYSYAQKNKSDSIQEVPELHCYSAEWNEKWESIQRLTEEQQMVSYGSAGDMVSSIHGSSTSFPKNMKHNVLENLSQFRPTADEDFNHETNYGSNYCTSETIISATTAMILDDDVKTIVEHPILQIKQSHNECDAKNDLAGAKESTIQLITTELVQSNTNIQNKICNAISKVMEDKNPLLYSVPFSAICSSAGNSQWKDAEKYVKKQYSSYSGFAGELISYTYESGIRMSQTRKANLKGSLSQPAEHAGDKSIHETQFAKSYTVFTELPLSKHTISIVTSENKEMFPSNKTTAEDIQGIVSLKAVQVNNTENPDITLKADDKELTKIIISKDVHTNNNVQSCDVLSISGKHLLVGINPCKSIQEEQAGVPEDQTVPNEIKHTDHKKMPCIVHKEQYNLDASNNSECKRLFPDIFADKDNDVSLYVDSIENSSVINAYSNMKPKETVQRILNSGGTSQQQNKNVDEYLNIYDGYAAKNICIHKHSQNISEQLEAEEMKQLCINNDEIKAPISRIEKKADITSFKDACLLEDADCLNALDSLPLCLSQPAIPTYLLRYHSSEVSQNNSKILKTDTIDLETCLEQSYQGKAEETAVSFNISNHSSTENKSNSEECCESVRSTITSCTKPNESTSLCHRNSKALINDCNNFEAFQEINLPVSSKSNIIFEETISNQINPQYEEMEINDRLNKTRRCETESTKVNTENKPYYKRNTLNNADQNCETQLCFAISLENSHKTELQIDCKLVTSEKAYQQPQLGAKTIIQLDSCVASISMQNIPTLEKQTLDVSADRQPNQITLEQSISTSENWVSNVGTGGNHPVLTQGTVMCENVTHYSETSNNQPSLIQHSLYKDTYLDIAENLCNEYSLCEGTLLKSKPMNETDHYVGLSSEEYDSDVSISEITSESNTDLHIDVALEKYQNASFDNETALVSESQNMVNSLEVSVQTDIFGLVHAEQCVCKKFCFYCKVCNQEMSENKEKKRHIISPDLERPPNKRAKCYNQEIQIMNSRDKFESENKMQIAENIRYVEDIQTLSQVTCFKTSATPLQPVANDNKYGNECNKKQHSGKGMNQHTQLFSWHTAEKSRSAKGFQEMNEQQNKLNLKPRASLRIGLSRRAKTKPLHYSCN